MRSTIAALCLGLSACSFDSAGLASEPVGQGSSSGGPGASTGAVASTTTPDPPTTSGTVGTSVTAADASTSGTSDPGDTSTGGSDGTGTSGPLDPDTGSSGSSSGGPPPPSCGDGKVDPGEACDDGNADDTDNCTSVCAVAVCGDGKVQANVEACDDGDADQTDECTTLCMPPTCSDGLKSGAETDKDCGGGTCTGCGAGGMCGDSDDCQSGACGNGVCVEVAASCLDLKKAQPAAPSGVYAIDPDKGGPLAPFDVYCEQTQESGGWTLVLKVDGTKPTFVYDAAIWGAPAVFNPDPGLNRKETKLASWTTVAATEVLVGMETPIKGNGPLDLQWVRLDAGKPNLSEVFKTDTYLMSALGRAAWKAFVADSSLQPNCDREGFNVGAPTQGAQDYARIRIGIIANGEMDCNTPNSYIGVGGGWIGQNCQGGLKSTTGNRALMSCDADNGTKDLAGFALVFVR